ncbi:MAG: TRAP transporter large permease [Marinovum algicola]|jgi:tripartite ATP-independent transporter DctM subunit|uniref:TRAP transporter large permease protein n=1 Tax=Marinovum algicola TaxID=42444 RepID=A0A975W8B0_9RHOB|nr:MULTISPECIES: TRAP transporter large permease [Marinovum]AKO96861.1 TRAP transporter, DctM subunit [Marinovum algicola DG 898]MDD9740765.1 TRAP transporter large permease [Marinovum sp. SP66]MDD9745271.1 TRAP transporter large permease [Marinovum sp. PR37]SEJ06785.1 TRAP transporter, DctM subunit [Marinovum algicola]SLN19499.1 Sialic acid TRAP transporter permease protein SiaT [Marinovum algicola]
MILLATTVSLIGLILINVPIAVAIGIVALGGLLLTPGGATLYDMAIALYSGTTSFPLIAIPLFILAGNLMNTSGISVRLINFVTALIGFVRGGLGMVNIGVSMVFAEISGSAVADVAATGTVLIPEMKKRGYSRTLAAAITSSSASLAIIIPPSIPMILYGAIAETSVLKLFIAGVVPGVLGGVLLMTVTYIMAVRYDLPRAEGFDLGHVWRSFKEALWALMMPVIILGGIFSGLVTATEGAGLAVLAALVIGIFIYRDLDVSRLRKVMLEGVSQTGVVMLLVATSAALGLFLTQAQVPQQLAQQITELTTNPLIVLALLNLLLLVLGMFLHGAAAIILVVPVVMPLVNAVGIDPIHFGIMVTLNLAIGQQTPPVASVLITSCSIAKAGIWETSRTNLPFIGVLAFILLLVTYVPQVSLALTGFIQ